ncbi:hypothetical protein [Clostridioides difficile]|uniref:hypothetical protein n=1 Tax=Clostridioides difficile TaxID=1496 RepID=UPI000D1DD22C|nr:hypothetical protein [Clostridioides difficile]HBE9444536.1 hypothetical protein [Clostridioides difficile]
MRISFKYINNIDERTFYINSKDKKPIEIQFNNNSIEASMIYSNAIESTFKGAANLFEGDINCVKFDFGKFGKIEKNRCDVKWSIKYSNLNTVIYVLNKNELRKENFYSKGICINNNKMNSLKNTSLNISNQIFKENLALAITCLQKSDINYKYSFENGFLQIFNIKSNSYLTSIDEIEEDDIYILLKLLNILIYQGRHLGVFLIDCTDISKDVLNCLQIVYEKFQRYINVNLLFFFNLDKNYKIDTQKIIIR